MIPYTNKINVVCQANHKIPAIRNRGNFQQGQAFFQNAFSEQVDVTFERRYGRLLQRLAMGKKMAYFLEQVIPKPVKRATCISESEPGTTALFVKGEQWLL